MKVRRLWVLPVSALLGLGLVATTPGLAEARDGWQRTRNTSRTPFPIDAAELCTYDFHTGPIGKQARGCFQPHGEVFWLKDLHRNGRPVVIRWRYHNTRTGARRAGDIYNDRGKAAGWTYLNKSFAENQVLWLKVCEANLRTRKVDNCSRNWLKVRT